MGGCGRRRPDELDHVRVACAHGRHRFPGQAAGDHLHALAAWVEDRDIAGEDEARVGLVQWVGPTRRQGFHAVDQLIAEGAEQARR